MNSRRPSVLSHIHQENRLNSKKSLRKLQISLEIKHGVAISHISVRSALHSLNLLAYSPIKKPLLTGRHINLRYQFSKEIVKISIDKIKTIIFSDESKFNLFYSDGKISVWREPTTSYNLKNSTPTVKYGGGSLMVCACFSYCGVGRLIFIDGIIDVAYYCNSKLY